LFDQQYGIFAGKFRRYHGQSWLSRLVDVKTLFYNTRDVLFVVLGIVQSWWLLRRINPDVILMKGGYVGVPIGLAASRKIPLVTHDSDAMSGLANRLGGRRARFHATTLPASAYPGYQASTVRQVGVIVADDYQLVTAAQQAENKAQLGLPSDQPLLMITGGSLGAESINKAMVKIVPDLLGQQPDLQVVHQVGKGHQDCYGSFHNSRLQVAELLPTLAVYLGAADVVVTRAGANTLAELGVLAKAAIVVPNPHLTGGHQLKNAQYLRQQQAIVEIADKTLSSATGQQQLETEILRLLANPGQRQKLAHKLHQVTVLDGAKQLAELLIQAANGVTNEAAT
jgi:UDP-N-acetylglucosamine:LPS N-acetylglucosamine transferase